MNKDIKNPTDPIPHDGIQKSLEIASWLPPDSIYRFQIEEGNEGITRDDLEAFERLAGRKTNSTSIPIPLFYQIERHGNGTCVFSIVRESQSKNTITPILQATHEGNEISAFATKELTEDHLSFVDKASNQLKRKIVEEAYLGNKPNYFLINSEYTTSDPNVVWLSKKSPLLLNSPHETQKNPHRRLYINIDFNQTDYFKFVKDLISLCREYDKPLYFKVLYRGSRIKNVISDPSSTKIVFFFSNGQEGKRMGERFALWLGNKSLIQQAPAGRENENVVLGNGKAFCGNRLLFAKGSKEDRRDIIEQLGRGNLSNLVVDMAKNHSIPF